MKNQYFVVVYSIYNDGKANKKAIYDAQDQEDAEYQFFKNMTSVRGDKTVSVALVQAHDIMNEYGRTETFVRKTNATQIE